MIDLIIVIFSLLIAILSIVLIIFIPKKPGTPGEQGIDGVTGITGPGFGLIGPTGPTGSIGVMGETGYQGSTGPIGNMGNQVVYTGTPINLSGTIVINDDNPINNLLLYSGTNTAQPDTIIVLNEGWNVGTRFIFSTEPLQSSYSVNICSGCYDDNGNTNTCETDCIQPYYRDGETLKGFRHTMYAGNYYLHVLGPNSLIYRSVSSVKNKPISIPGS